MPLQQGDFSFRFSVFSGCVSFSLLFFLLGGSGVLHWLANSAMGSAGSGFNLLDGARDLGHVLVPRLGDDHVLLQAHTSHALGVCVR